MGLQEGDTVLAGSVGRVHAAEQKPRGADAIPYDDEDLGVRGRHGWQQSPPLVMRATGGDQLGDAQDEEPVAFGSDTVVEEFVACAACRRCFLPVVAQRRGDGQGLDGAGFVCGALGILPASGFQKACRASSKKPKVLCNG